MSDDHDADTLLATQASEGHRVQVSLPPLFLANASADERYTADRVLGEGGMGIVSLCHDQRIGRNVAHKVLRSTYGDDESQRRFLREAQLQGQLEHPAVVPVYDLGSRKDGSLYFTMKRIRGVTLHEIVQGVRRADPDVVAKYPRHKLLHAFAQVCLAIEFAHRRGVVHRDLKPSNIMLGDFGEVYVLDWGIAKIGDAAVDSDQARMSAAALEAISVPPTQAGAVLGTPGYMAPEQLRGEDVGPAADIYALGAILFELLAFEPLHPRGRVEVMIASTLDRVDARPSARAPHLDIPPELDRVCETATALPPAGRFATVLALHDAIDQFLAGARDLELRQTKAAEHAEAAREEVRTSLDASSDDVIAARRRAMKHIGSALGLDPTNRDAIAAMTELLTNQPTRTPPEVAAAIELGEARRLRKIARFGAWVYLGSWSFLPILLWIGIRAPLPVILLYAGLTVAGLVSLKMKMSPAPRPAHALLAMLASNLGFGAISGFFGPLVFVPTLAVVNTLAFTIHVAKRYRPLVFAVGLATFAIPLALEMLNLLPASYQFGAGGMLIVPQALELPGTATMVGLAVAQIAAVLLGALTVGILRDNLDESERRTYIYAWHLREFVPDEHKRETDPMRLGKASRRGKPV